MRERYGKGFKHGREGFYIWRKKEIDATVNRTRADRYQILCMEGGHSTIEPLRPGYTLNEYNIIIS